MSINKSPDIDDDQNQQLDFSIIDKQSQQTNKFNFFFDCLLTDRDKQQHSDSKNKNTITGVELEDIDSIAQKNMHIQNGSFLKDLAKFQQEISFQKSVHDVYGQNNNSKEENQYTMQMQTLKTHFKKNKNQFEDSAQATTNVSGMESKFTNLELTKKINKIISKQKKSHIAPFSHLIIDFKDNNIHKKYKKVSHGKMKTCGKTEKGLSSIVIQANGGVKSKNSSKLQFINKTKHCYHRTSLQKITLSNQVSPRQSINVRHSYQNINSKKNLYQSSNKLKKSKSKQQLSKPNFSTQQILFDTKKQYFGQTPKHGNYFKNKNQSSKQFIKSKKSLTNTNNDKTESTKLQFSNGISQRNVIIEKIEKETSKRKNVVKKFQKKTGIFVGKPIR